MSVGIIDIGSNTIRLSVFDKKTLKQIANGVDYAGLIAYVSDGRLSEEGKLVLCNAILKLKAECDNLRCFDIKAFATASLRDICDKDGLISDVFQKTGVIMEIISGEREAYLDYLGLKKEYDTETGAVFDLGGGSAQLITFRDGKVIDYTSKKIGALKLYKDSVSGIFPTEAESDKIREFVKSELCGFKSDKHSFSYAMGGAASAISKLYEKMFNKKTEYFSISEIRAVAEIPENVIRAVIPERLYTIRPALIVIEEILNTLKTDKIKCVTCGVRDGMICEIIN